MIKEKGLVDISDIARLIENSYLDKKNTARLATKAEIKAD